MKAYWTVTCKKIEDKKPLMIIYQSQPCYKKYNGKIIVIGKKIKTLKSKSFPMIVVIKFLNIDDALKCYNSIEDQEAQKISKGIFDRHIQIIEGIQY